MRGELRKVLDWYRNILTTAEEYYRQMEGDIPTRLEAFATCLEELGDTLPEPPNLKEIDPKLPDVKIPDAVKKMLEAQQQLYDVCKTIGRIRGCARQHNAGSQTLPTGHGA